MNEFIFLFSLAMVIYLGIALCNPLKPGNCEKIMRMEFKETKNQGTESEE